MANYKTSLEYRNFASRSMGVCSSVISPLFYIAYRLARFIRAKPDGVIFTHSCSENGGLIEYRIINTGGLYPCDRYELQSVNTNTDKVIYKIDLNGGSRKDIHMFQFFSPVYEFIHTYTSVNRMFVLEQYKEGIEDDLWEIYYRIENWGQ